MPMGPTQSDLHINGPLTNVAVRYGLNTSSFIADKVFPSVPVDKQSDDYWIYGKFDWHKAGIVQHRAPATEAAKAGWQVGTGSYHAKPYALAHDIDDQRRANADSNFKIDSDATRFVTNALLLQRELHWVDAFFKAGVWGKDWTGVASGENNTSTFRQFNDFASDPVGFFEDLHIAFTEGSGQRMNKLVMGRRVLKALKNHPDILDRIKHVERGQVTKDLLASLFEVDEIYVPDAVYATGPDKNDQATNDAGATMQFIVNSKAVLGVHAPAAPSTEVPSAGYTFKWTGYPGPGNKQGTTVRKFRMEHLRADRVEGEMSYDMKVVAADMGVFLASAVA